MIAPPSRDVIMANVEEALSLPLDEMFALWRWAEEFIAENPDAESFLDAVGYDFGRDDEWIGRVWPALRAFSEEPDFKREDGVTRIGVLVALLDEVADDLGALLDGEPIDLILEREPGGLKVTMAVRIGVWSAIWRSLQGAER